MTIRLSLPFWPTSLDNLRWSADNFIAVGGGDVVAILIPKLKAKGTTAPPWDIVILKINEFTAQEVPVHDPLSFANWSLGEEVSLRHVLTLDWSPLGPGRFGGCILTVLHSNYTLTLWDCNGKADVQDNWRISLILNHTVRRYYDSIDPIPSHASQWQAEQRQVRQRIRAFAWNTTRLDNHSPAGSPDSDDSSYRKDSHIAISTEASDILIMQILSSHDSFAPQSAGWKANVTHRIDCSECLTINPTLHIRNAAIATGTQVGQKQHKRAVAEEIAWSHSASDCPAVLAFIVQGRLYTTRLRPSEGNTVGVTENEPSEHLFQDRNDICGPLRFIPGSQHLFCFATDAILCTNISTDRSHKHGVKQHHLDGRWDAVSGLAFTIVNDNMPAIHVTSHLTSATATSAKFDLSLDASSGTPALTAWQRAIRDQKAAFSSEHELRGNVHMRTWGLAASPLGDFTVTCTNTLPSDSVSHVIHSEHNCTVNITREWEPTSTQLLPTPYYGRLLQPDDVSAEAVYSSLRSSIDDSVRNEVSLRSLEELTLQAIEQSSESSKSTRTFVLSTSMAKHGSELAASSSNLASEVYWRPHMSRSRTERLVNHILHGRCETQLSVDGYRTLTRAVFALSESAPVSPSDSLSAKIRGVYRVVQKKLDDHSGEYSESRGTEEDDWHETCSICQENMHFEAMKWSRCPRGHRFSRCSISFLTIPQPGASKACKICSAQYLNEQTLPELQPQLLVNITDNADEHLTDNLHDGAADATIQYGEMRKPAVSLARLLFTICDRCIICGGKFASG